LLHGARADGEPPRARDAAEAAKATSATERDAALDATLQPEKLGAEKTGTCSKPMTTFIFAV
jgi:hypothetical protein